MFTYNSSLYLCFLLVVINFSLILFEENVKAISLVQIVNRLLLIFTEMNCRLTYILLTDKMKDIEKKCLTF